MGKLFSIWFVSFFVFLSATVAHAQSIEVDADIALATEFVDRGVSVSSEQPSILGNLTLTHLSNIYLGAFTARVDNEFGDDIQADIFVGYFRQIGAYEVDVNINYSTLRGHPGANGFVEFGASVGRDIDLAYIRVGFVHAPSDQRHLDDSFATFYYTDLDIPISSQPWLTLAVRCGHERFGDDGPHKWNWGLGARATHKNWEAELMYHDTNFGNDDNTDGRVVFALKRYF